MTASTTKEISSILLPSLGLLSQRLLVYTNIGRLWSEKGLRKALLQKDVTLPADALIQPGFIIPVQLPRCSLTVWGELFLHDKKAFALGRREKIEWKSFIFTWTTIILLTQGKVLTGFCCWGIKSHLVHPLFWRFSFLILWFKCSNMWLRKKWKCTPWPIWIFKSPRDCGAWGIFQRKRLPHSGF